MPVCIDSLLLAGDESPQRGPERAAHHGLLTTILAQQYQWHHHASSLSQGRGERGPGGMMIAPGQCLFMMILSGGHDGVCAQEPTTAQHPQALGASGSA